MTSSPTENEAGEKEDVRSKTDFSIDHILNRAGNSASERKTLENSNITGMPFPWLHCTRYCPPKIPRNPKREGPQKRQLGRHPRIPFTSQQLAVLEEKFRQTPYLSSTEVTKLSRNLQLADIRVKIWFQNRRARERRERAPLETEQKLLTSSVNLPPSLPISSQQTSALSDLEENASTSNNSSALVAMSPIFPLVGNYPIYEDVRTTPFLLKFSKPFVNDDSN